MGTRSTSFAVKGDFFDLTFFEIILKHIGFTLVTDRSVQEVWKKGDKENYITSNIHAISGPGTYICARNNGAAVHVFNLTEFNQFKDAVAHAISVIRNVAEKVPSSHVFGTAMDIPIRHHKFLAIKSDENGSTNRSTTPSPKPLFFGTDGFPIYDEGRYWIALPRSQSPSEWICYENRIYLEGIKQSIANKKIAYFSSREAAQKWIDENNPVFTTKDGVDIKKGGEAFYVNEKEWKVNRWMNIQRFNKYDHIHYFSTRELAEKFLKENEPTFTISSIKEKLRSLRLWKEGLNPTLYYETNDVYKLFNIK